ncbi:MAG: glycosidase [Candidatus Hydrogenedentota bacterium]
MAAVSTAHINVTRLSLRLHRDEKRIITRPFVVGSEHRLAATVEHIRSLDSETVAGLLDQVIARFGDRHQNVHDIFLRNFQHVEKLTGHSDELPRNYRLLIGSYFTMEHSIASAALFNPSIVPDDDQSNVPPGGIRFVMSLRATGEGHVSCVVFRRGSIYANGDVTLDPPSRYTTPIRQSPDNQYVKALYRRKLSEMTANMRIADELLEKLPEDFTFAELQQVVGQWSAIREENPQMAETADTMLWLAHCNYRLELPPDANISELVIFPNTENESKGIEDLRMVQFTHEDGKKSYFGTYSAYNGVRMLPMLMEWKSGRTIHIHTMNGECARNKGMALFPRRINGHFAMCGRLDGQNLYIMYSDMVHFWETATLLAKPEYPWELMLMGNCGSPIETEAGWLLITHGVGPMRQYSIGAMLLDINDPTRIIGRLRDPLMTPTEDEREGYTPNVLYSCGSMVFGNLLYIPYAMSDQTTGMATVEVEALIRALLASPPG